MTYRKKGLENSLLFDLYTYFDNEKSGVTHWLVTDLSGKLLLTKEQNERSGVIDLGDFRPGVYLLQVFTPEGTKVQKLIKE